MSLHLDQKALENIKSYKYRTNPLTWIEVNAFEYFWNFTVKLIPKWVAPNLLTVLGLLFPILQFIILLSYDWTLSKPLPSWVYVLQAFSLWWYQTIDAIDGKQARRTDNCSPLGQFLDHNLDMISYVFFYIGACQTLLTGTNIWRLLMMFPPLLTPHYSIEYRSHFTHWHITVVGLFGATECLII